MSNTESCTCARGTLSRQLHKSPCQASPAARAVSTRLQFFFRARLREILRPFGKFANCLRLFIFRKQKAGRRVQRLLCFNTKYIN